LISGGVEITKEKIKEKKEKRQDDGAQFQMARILLVFLFSLFFTPAGLAKASPHFPARRRFYLGSRRGAYIHQEGNLRPSVSVEVPHSLTLCINGRHFSFVRVVRGKKNISLLAPLSPIVLGAIYLNTSIV